MASHLGMSVSQCQHSMTYSEYMAWQVWLEDQWNEPNRTDFYLMQIAAYLDHSSKKKDLDSYKIPFKWKKKRKSKTIAPNHKKLVTQMAKARWGVIVDSKPPKE